MEAGVVGSNPTILVMQYTYTVGDLVRIKKLPCWGSEEGTEILSPEDVYKTSFSKKALAMLGSIAKVTNIDRDDRGFWVQTSNPGHYWLVRPEDVELLYES